MEWQVYMNLMPNLNYVPPYQVVHCANMRFHVVGLSEIATLDCERLTGCQFYQLRTERIKKLREIDAGNIVQAKHLLQLKNR